MWPFQALFQDKRTTPKKLSNIGNIPLYKNDDVKLMDSVSKGTLSMLLSQSCIRFDTFKSF